MFNNHVQFLCLLVHILLRWSIPASCQTPRPQPLEVVYRADSRTPEQVRLHGGFWPRGFNQSRPTALGADFSLFNHVQGTHNHTSRDDSGYVSTSANADFAEQHLLDRLGASGYVYAIHTSEVFIDVAATLGDYYATYEDEEEYAAITGIRWEQVIGWTEYRNGDIVSRGLNPDYQSHVYDHRLVGGAQPQLAGFPEGHPAWLAYPWNMWANCADKRKRSQPQDCGPEETAMTFGSDYLASVVKFDAMKIMVELSTDFFSGTDDLIGVCFGTMDSCVDLFDRPSPGQSVSVDANMTALFHTDQVPLNAISRLVIFQNPVPHPIASDDFKVRGIKVSVRQVETKRWLQNGDFAHLDEWMGTNLATLDAVWSGNLKLESWQGSSCRRLKAEGLQSGRVCRLD